MTTIGQRLAESRKKAGFTQEQAANHLGVKRPTLASWETDRAEIGATTLKMLAELYNTSADVLLNTNFKTEQSKEFQQLLLLKNMILEYAEKIQKI